MSFILDRRFLFVFILAVAAIVFFHRLNESPLAGDDTYYSQVAKEMALTGNYLTPQYGGNMDFHTSKPPVFFWMNAFSGKILGFTNAAMRLPSAVLCFLGVAALLFFVNRYVDHLTAFFSALILVFTQQYMYHARSAVTDGPFAVFFALAMMSFWVARTERKDIFFYVSGLFIGLAVMTRQIPGLFAIPVILTTIVLCEDFWIFRKPHFYLGMAFSAAVFAPWHIIMYIKHGNAFLNQYMGVALMTGIKGYPASYSGNPSLNPWYAYFSILLSNYWPWLPFTAAGFFKIFRSFRQVDPERRKLYLFLLCWVIVTLAIFQTAKVKQYHYIVPLYPPLAVITALVFGGYGEAGRKRSVIILGLIAASASLAYLAYPVIPKTLDSREYIDTIKLVPEVKALDLDLSTLRKGGMHYLSCFRFYADKGIELFDEQALLDRIGDRKKGAFILFREDYERLSKELKEREVIVLAETPGSVLFTNK